MWRVKIHPLVLREDFKNIDLPQQKIILKAISKKLSVHPEAYGQPLGGEFSVYWRLRVQDHRVIYRIIKDEIVVLVVKIGIRKDDRVYQEFFARLRKLKG